MPIKIITDSTANITSDQIHGIDHVTVPLSLHVDGKLWLDTPDIDLDKFLYTLKHTKNKSTSACPNVNDWLKAFEGSDEIFVITLTSALSGSYNSATQAAKIYHEKNPKAKILVFDSRSAGPQLRLLAEKIASLASAGKSFEEIVKATEEYQHHLDLMFALQDLTNLGNNGRITPAVAKIAGLLKLFVIGTANNKGEFELLGKARGAKKARRKLLDDMVKAGYRGGRVQIDHVQNEGSALSMKEIILDNFPDAKVTIGECGALCSFYAEEGGLMVGFEKE